MRRRIEREEMSNDQAPMTNDKTVDFPLQFEVGKSEHLWRLVDELGADNLVPVWVAKAMLDDLRRLQRKLIEAVSATEQTFVEEQTFVDEVAEYAGEQFCPLSRVALIRALVRCCMTQYPTPTNGEGERASGACVCRVCGEEFRNHPADWRLLGYHGCPVVHILCDGRRVKL